MKTTFFPILLVLFSNSCATHRTYEHHLMDWEGLPATELVKAWGVPSTVSTLRDGGKLYLYLRRNEDKLKVKKAGSDQVVTLYDCKTSFLANPEGIIQAWKYEGHACHVEEAKVPKR